MLLVVDDSELMVRALVRALSRETSMHVVGARDEREVMALLDQHERPQVALIDVDIDADKTAGFRVAALLRARCGPMPIALMTGHEDRELPNLAMDQQLAFFRKDGAERELRAWARDAAHAITTGPAERARAVGELAREWKLSPREAEFLTLAAERELPVDEVGRALEIKPSTAATYVKNIIKASRTRSLHAAITLVHRRAAENAKREASAARALAHALGERVSELESKLARRTVDAEAKGGERSAKDEPLDRASRRDDDDDT